MKTFNYKGKDVTIERNYNLEKFYGSRFLINGFIGFNNASLVDDLDSEDQATRENAIEEIGSCSVPMADDMKWLLIDLGGSEFMHNFQIDDDMMFIIGQLDNLEYHYRDRALKTRGHKPIIFNTDRDAVKFIYNLYCKEK